MRLVALTGYGQDNDRRRSVDAGFQVHLVKPIDAATVAQVVWQSDFARQDAVPEAIN